MRFSQSCQIFCDSKLRTEYSFILTQFLYKRIATLSNTMTVPSLKFIDCSKFKNLVKNKINKPYNAFYFDKFQIISQRKYPTLSKKLLRRNLALGINIEILLVS